MAKSTFVCPFCFEKCKVSDVQFRCSNKRCPDVEDIEMTRYLNGDINMPMRGKRTFRPSKGGFGIPNSAKCPDCGTTTFRRICPACHNELPESTLEGRDMIISVVGGRATGKSHFVGVMIKELRDRIAVSFDGALEGFDDSYQRWQQTFGKHLYEDGQKLELTRSSVADSNNGAYKPLIFKLKIQNHGLFGNKIDSFTFVFFDTAGEDLNDADTMTTVNKYICKSAGIIFLLDPMQIPAVTSKLNADEVSRAAAIDWRHAAQADDIMTRVSNLIRNSNGLAQNRKIDIPVAAVFSKFDAIESIVPQDCAILTPSPHCAEQKFDLADWHNVNAEVRGLLNEWGATAFTSQLDTNYTKYSYFAVSALGLHNNPTASGRIKRPAPHRIEDPLLWLLKENGVIKGK